jgi:hypothetical protein
MSKVTGDKGPTHELTQPDTTLWPLGNRQVRLTMCCLHYENELAVFHTSRTEEYNYHCV